MRKKIDNELLGENVDKINSLSGDQGAMSDSSIAKDIVPDATSEIVQALEQELSERKKQIVTSFQLQELNHSSRAQRRSSVKSNVVIWSKAEEQ